MKKQKFESQLRLISICCMDEDKPKKNANTDTDDTVIF